MPPHSGELDRAVVITVIAVRMMKVAVDQIVDMIAMRYRFVSAARPVDMVRIMGATVMARCTSVRVLCADLKPVLVYVIGMRMMQVPVMQVIDVIAMFDGRVPAVCAVLMVVVGVMGFVAGAHLEAPRFARDQLPAVKHRSQQPRQLFSQSSRDRRKRQFQSIGEVGDSWWLSGFGRRLAVCCHGGLRRPPDSMRRCGTTKARSLYRSSGSPERRQLCSATSSHTVYARRLLF
jgi:hypothetical protein